MTQSDPLILNLNASPEVPNRRAVIDIGTNSVKLLVADLAAGGLLTPVCEVSRQTRLGAGFYGTQKLQRPAIALTAAAVAEFRAAAAKLGAASVRAIATSAARDARNAVELIDAVRQSSGLETEILSGDKEAEWVFRGVTSNPNLAQSPVLILDVGGGSTEFIVGDHAVPQFRSSYSLGTVRLLEQLRLNDPPGLAALAECRAWLKDYLKTQVVSFIEPALRACRGPVRLVGTGGSATILARLETRMPGFDRDTIEAAQISLPRIQAQLQEQWQMPLAQRQQIIGMPPNRGDVILTGMAIYESIMTQFGMTQLGVSTRGLRYWALLHP
jgi:exopolyphosphatase / guanosine-5'-triphosphate,3'-diphosphate pyrophosphatase